MLENYTNFSCCWKKSEYTRCIFNEYNMVLSHAGRHDHWNEILYDNLAYYVYVLLIENWYRCIQ